MCALAHEVEHIRIACRCMRLSIVGEQICALIFTLVWAYMAPMLHSKHARNATSATDGATLD